MSQTKPTTTKPTTTKPTTTKPTTSIDPNKRILPGAKIGMVGGGQLGRMFAHAATAMGYEVVVFCDSAEAPAAQVTGRVVVGDLSDLKAIDRFASQCDVISLEFENIPAATIDRCSKHASTYPDASVLATAQDRWIEKSTLANAGLPVTPFAEVHDAQTLAAVAESMGWPLVIKTARSGYDGKGQYRINSPEEASAIAWSEADRWVAEQWIQFDCEVSVIVARSVSGQTESFPVFENDHQNHILDISLCPASIPASVADSARKIAVQAADVLGVVGLLCVEFFVRGDQVMINEVAPRPHNSGHLTIEACHTSQFQQHVRAICNLPLGNTGLRCGAAAMANLLGDLWPEQDECPPWDQSLAVPSVNLHLYGKRDAKAGRKMGHLTATGNDRGEVKRLVQQARDSLKNL